MTDTQTALVVGASRGIGLAITRQLLEQKSLRRVYASYRDRETAAGLLEINDERLLSLKLDVTNPDDFKALADTVKTNGDRPDYVVHCAGILHEDALQPEKALSQCRQDKLLRMFQVNSIGPLLLARALVPLIPKDRPAQFAALSAMVGSIGDNRLGGWYGYRASKAALNQFMRTLAVECSRSHPQLCITAIHPGTTDTALSKPFQSNVRPGKLYSANRSAARILKVVSAGEPSQSGRFVNWDGKPIPW
ncbi:MAG: SDR family NAD(P)-dependent oxidoreductase [Gammaproteobacteria bacterium]|nr:SDR family NAD(P)-dependent oxidoreductase [Gammaproteobacteria bacterium]NNK99475.1 SDR family NAD(P)-dependent oxidoreductase [Xanthomonadales bacterium]